jgi:hypothetical protein
MMLRHRFIAALFLVLLPRWCAAQASQHALRFFGTGVGPPGFQDRVLIPLDDNTNAITDGSAPADIGAGSFTLEWWMRGNLADNATSSSGGDQTFNDNRWIEGNIILDRDIWCGSERKFGISIAGGYVRFGTSAGDPPGADAGNSTIEGNRPVLDGQWHHVAVVRDAATGARHIYVDGLLDYSGARRRVAGRPELPEQRGAGDRQLRHGPAHALRLVSGRGGGEARRGRGLSFLQRLLR